MDRRGFLWTLGSAATVAALPGCEPIGRASDRGAESRWGRVRNRFLIDEDYVHLAGMLLAPHPDLVRAAIAQHRDALDRNPTLHLEEEYGRLQHRSRAAAAEYMGAGTDDVGLTDSTTMGIGLVYSGVQVRPGQELLTTAQDYPATHDALEYRAAESGADVRFFEPFEDVREASVETIVEQTLSEIRDTTRVLAATWVHSRTGLKLPVQSIAEGLAGINEDRSLEDRVLFCLDGVHGLGVEDVDVPDLGCDFFFAGTHKWIFAPRGTGVVWGRPEVQDQVVATIPTFTRDGTWGGSMTPGGFKPFEHQWGMAEAFEFHRDVGGRREVQERIHHLAERLKQGLQEMDRVTLWTPPSQELSAGVVCFDVEDTTPQAVVDGLLDRKVIASVSPYDRPFARFSPGLQNTDEDIDRALRALEEVV